MQQVAPAPIRGIVFTHPVKRKPMQDRQCSIDLADVRTPKKKHYLQQMKLLMICLRVGLIL